MKSRTRTYAGRFVVESTPEKVVDARQSAYRRSRGNDPAPGEEALWLIGIEVATGKTVWISPRGRLHDWPWQVEDELFARQVMALQSPFIVPVLHVGPGVVYAEPPPAYPRPTLTRADAAACAIQACEVLAHMHALGVPTLRCGPSHLRLTKRDGAWRIAWLVPGVDVLDVLDTQRAKQGRSQQQLVDEAVAAFTAPVVAVEAPPIVEAQRDVTNFFAGLLAADEAASAATGPAMTELRRIARGEAHCPDMAALARLFLPLVTDPGPWAARIEAMPVVRTLPIRERDWDGIIRDGEATLAVGQYRRHLELPLASAYHQRASRACAAGELEAALADVERAVQLDRHVDYRTTRAVLLERLGRRQAARAEITKVVDIARKNGSFRRDGVIVGRSERVEPADLARALAVAGLFALHDGDLAAAEPALRESLALHETAACAHALGAALYRNGDLEAAAQHEARSVEIEPNNGRYRWALVISLLRLGRREEASEHARAVLRLEPDDPGHQARFAELFGETPEMS